MATILTYHPSKPPQRTPASGTGRAVIHICRDANGRQHRQRLSLGSMRGVFYLDALCLHCGAHLMWVEEETTESARTTGTEKPPAGRRTTKSRGKRNG